MLTGERSQVHDAIVGYFTDTQRMLRTERWKYVRYPQVGKEQLFDLATDADELHNLSTAAAQVTTKRELTEQLDDWLRHTATRYCSINFWRCGIGGRLS